jgi:hypothetical protein
VSDSDSLLSFVPTQASGLKGNLPTNPAQPKHTEPKHTEPKHTEPQAQKAPGLGNPKKPTPSNDQIKVVLTSNLPANEIDGQTTKLAPPNLPNRSRQPSEAELGDQVRIE